MATTTVGLHEYIGIHLTDHGMIQMGSFMINPKNIDHYVMEQKGKKDICFVKIVTTNENVFYGQIAKDELDKMDRWIIK